ncbi:MULTISPECIES: PspC domain-containing protein [Sediminibacillus]|uniref:Phage shock protein PspC (Stress-responsive transcriptional regulator) n=2 Tax=Sediminibacillus TaxID=482460 RepID=A0A1G9RAC9_9BACI|nr:MULTISPECIES: PspC domain-containing protein [Sediminibacillus]QTN00357.1 PspC domain-containing protein [Sediminibacillus dalangtanensis]SDM19807.1 Phage shock protein PspC (stress-responsive transcriptional regulator) [Sediminibacillus halophilus]
MSRKLYRSRSDRKISGVLGGMADYFDMDATLLRLLFVLIFVFTGFFPLGILYILAIFIMPKEPFA